MLKDHLLSYLEQYRIEGPLLLGLSGGPDSVSLFHALVALDFPFEVAHLNHGWRQEAEQEALFVEELCKSHRKLFHYRRMEKQVEKNKEDFARNQRFLFFEELLIKRSQLCGIVLAHHADDQAETVLKRLFEGARFSRLEGLKEKSEIGGYPIYRPLLSFDKKELVNWLQEKNLDFCIDQTNMSGENLRGKMRTQILPFLESAFGKNIKANLLNLATHAQIFKEKKLSENVEEHLVLPQVLTMEESIRSYFDKFRVCLSRGVIKTLMTHVVNRSPNKWLRIKQGKILCNRGIIQFFALDKRIDEESQEGYDESVYQATLDQ